jgi:hypothetical protein
MMLMTILSVPTTAGTGSETTGTAILDITSQSFKTGIANRALKPMLGIVDTYNTDSCSKELHISAGLDVLFHSLESYTAIPYEPKLASDIKYRLILFSDTPNAPLALQIPSSAQHTKAPTLSPMSSPSGHFVRRWRICHEWPGTPKTVRPNNKCCASPILVI